MEVRVNDWDDWDPPDPLARTWIVVLVAVGIFLGVNLGAALWSPPPADEAAGPRPAAVAR
jgi:hypothetical protein